jgi:hypothetical protein
MFLQLKKKLSLNWIFNLYDLFFLHVLTRFIINLIYHELVRVAMYFATIGTNGYILPCLLVQLAVLSI